MGPISYIQVYLSFSQYKIIPNYNFLNTDVPRHKSLYKAYFQCGGLADSADARWQPDHRLLYKSFLKPIMDVA